MASPKQLHHIATSPHAYAHFQITGQLPATVRPTSPLITLLEALTPRERMAITSLKVNEQLGYLNSRQFHSAEAALHWLKPSNEMLASESWPSESYRIKRMTHPVYLDALVANAARVPDGLLARYTKLRDPAAMKAEREAHCASEDPGDSGSEDSDSSNSSERPG